MKILHIIHTPRHSGAEILVCNISRLHSKSGHKVFVCALFPVNGDFHHVISDYSEITWILPTQRLGRLGRILFVLRAFKNIRPDLMFAHSVLPALYSRLVIWNQVICVLHDASQDDYKDWKYRLTEYFLSRVTRAVIAVSDKSKENYKKKFSCVPVLKIANGIDLNKFQNKDLRSARAEIRQEFGFSESTLILLQVGRITRIKQHSSSIEALKVLCTRDVDFVYLFAGLVDDEDLYSKLMVDIETFDLSDRVHYLGQRSDIGRLLSAADLYLMPSSHEAHSVAMIEALASGIGIVASNIDSFEFSKKFPGVILCDVQNPISYADAILSFDKFKRFERDLGVLDIKHTASSYLKISDYY